MSNTRRFKPGRQARRQSLKAQLKQAEAENAYYRGFATSLQAQLRATQMERPADLDEWIESVIPDMDEAERAEWEAMTPDEREEFLDQLGHSINVAQELAAAGVDEPASPTA